MSYCSLLHTTTIPLTALSPPNPVTNLALPTVEPNQLTQVRSKIREKRSDKAVKCIFVCYREKFVKNK